MPVIDAAWNEWLALNAGRGCTPASMIDAMVQAGFERSAAQLAVNQVLGGTVAAAPATAHNTAYHYDPAPVPAGNNINAAGRDVPVLARFERPQVIVFGDVLTPAECEELIRRAQYRLQRSTTIEPATGRGYIIQERTSDSASFPRGEDAFIAGIEARIAALMHWPVEHGEGLQVLRYGVGGEYRPHFYYFPPEQPGSASRLATGGQRVATLVIYLNEVAAGGETTFPAAGIAVTARRGSAVYFRYLNGQRQLDPLTLHAGTPVIQGEKWILTQWMRERRWQ